MPTSKQLFESTSSTASAPPLNWPYPEEILDWNAILGQPYVDETAYIAPNAIVVGRVTLKAHSSVWYNCVLRGDGEFIEVGEETNVQDGSILHTDAGYPCILKNRVSLGHRAIVHASTVEEGALIGIGATVLSRCVIGAGALIAASAVVKEGVHVPPNTLWAGCPARQIRELSPEHQERLVHTYRHYVNLAMAYRLQPPKSVNAE